MTTNELLDLVRRQVGSQWRRRDWPHGVILDRCILNPPERRAFDEQPAQLARRELWVVLEEYPEDRTGYCVVYDEAEGRFGLGMASTDGPFFLGFYGDFVTALESM